MYAEKLLLHQELCPDIPLKDAVGNAVFLVDHYCSMSLAHTRLPDKKILFDKSYSLAANVLRKVEDCYGKQHSYQRSAELFEKSAVVSMLAQGPPEEIVDMALTAMRLRAALDQTPSYTTARTLRCATVSCLFVQRTHA